MSALLPATLPLPDFAQLTPDTLKQSVLDALGVATALLDEAERPDAAANLIERLELAENQLQQCFAVLSNLNAVRNTPELRDTYNGLLPELSRFYTAQGQHQALYQRFVDAHDAPSFAQLPTPAKRPFGWPCGTFDCLAWHLQVSKKPAMPPLVNACRNCLHSFLTICSMPLKPTPAH
ncbi:MAG: hypothetical protein RLY58_1068 [Pseudomonadota bacterium]|jgi:Zn-dependent oligopeptidase